MSLHSGERQVAETVQGIRRDHVARYEWAASCIGIGVEVRDLGCGCGYGSSLIATLGKCFVIGIDADSESIKFARKHYGSMRTSFVVGNVEKIFRVSCDVAIAFEIIEHLDHPDRMLGALTDTKRLLASVPNEAIFPYATLTERGKTFHRRHYTAEQFRKLLRDCGWKVTAWFTQDGVESEVEIGDFGRTLIADCSRVTA